MKILFIFGTRPETIKMAPLIKEFQKEDAFDVKICVTAQHREMLDQVMEFFQIKSHYDLNMMKKNQTLFDITINALKGIEEVLNNEQPHVIFVQGDTTTVLTGALAGYYTKTKVAHLEAGLRSHNKLSPYPEEVNRIITGHIADYHFAPTEKAKDNLENENIKANVFVVGNTVIDALQLGLKIIGEKNKEKEITDFFSKNINNFTGIIESKKVILVTGHRRESFGKPFEDICEAMLEIVKQNENAHIIYPVHMNPNVREPVNRILNDNDRIHLIEPLSYPYLIWLMEKSYVVLTDSGGIQEEAPALGKPVLVMRDVTERTEGVEAGTAKLVGTDMDKIIQETGKLLNDKSYYNNMAKAVNPYGDGTTSRQIVDIFKNIIINREKTG
ncbi:non-hydrolyzing UDP-N-acetylglucosamine 2-epimerase [Spirochaetota bacterium]